MKLLTSWMLLGMAASAFGAVPYKEALEQAETQKKNIVVICVGSDWLPSSASIVKSFEELEKAYPQKDILWAIYDEKENASEEELKAPKPPVEIWNFPAIQVLDKSGRRVYYREGLKPSLVIKMQPAIEKYNQAIAKRDQLWEESDKQSGKKAAELIFQGMKLMPDDMARAYKPQIERLIKEDPDDSTGAHMRYTFGFLPYMEKEINAKIKEEQFDQAQAYIDKSLKNPALTKYQKQSLWAGQFRLLKEQGQLPKALEALNQLIKVDPKSDFAQGARNLIGYYTKPVIADGLSWDQRDNRPLWLPILFKVSSVIKEPGTYEVEFKHHDGHTKFRNPIIKLGGRELSKVNDDKESRVFTIDVPKVGGNLILQMDIQGTGWFAGRGDVLIRKK